MTTYTLTFDIRTTADPSHLLDLIIGFQEELKDQLNAEGERARCEDDTCCVSESDDQ